MQREKSCGAVVFRKNSEVKYLVLHYGAGHWDFAKGQVEKGEEEKETVLREIKEETGIRDARFVEGFRQQISYFYKRGGETIYKEVVFFLLETQCGDVKLSYEHVGYEWLSHELIMKRLTHKNARNVLQKAHEFLKARQIVEG